MTATAKDQSPRFRTAGGVVVEGRGKVEVRDGHRKLRCYKALTGGAHGFLKVRNLTPLNDAARALVGS